MWVVWGMGNLLSNNSPRCCTTESTDGVVVTVTVGDTATGGAVAVTGLAFTPTWNERATYRVLPAEATLAAGTDAGARPPTCRARCRCRPGRRSAESTSRYGHRVGGVGLEPQRRGVVGQQQQAPRAHARRAPATRSARMRRSQFSSALTFSSTLPAWPASSVASTWMTNRSAPSASAREGGVALALVVGVVPAGGARRPRRRPCR